ncbi:MAG: GYD domain-containing protein [Chloroflexi bacterium]|nr:GYD domain-containing protein [Chloroflexota bacterium]
MPKYLVQGSYSQAGVQGLLKDGGTSRRTSIDSLIKGMGGSLEAFYYAFGKNDMYVIADLPDDATATAVSLAVGASGSASLKTTVLVTPETVDEAVKKTVNYRPPGS